MKTQKNTKKERTERTEEETRKLESELEQAVTNWVNITFNFISFDVIYKCDEYYYEKIRQREVTAEDIADYTGEEVEKVWEDCEAVLENHKYYNDVREEREQDNHPMWSTLFEFRGGEPSEEWIKKAIKVGFGIIEDLDDFNTCLFVSGCGYSFYSAHWIPLYLSIFDWEAEKYKGINYRHL